MKPGQFIDMPASSYRPSPPSTRQRAQTEPDRQLVELPSKSPGSALDELLEEHARETTLRSAPEPPATEERADVAAKKVKKKRMVVSDEQRVVAVARVDRLIAAGNPAGKAVASVAKELGVSESAVINWRTAERKNGGAKPAKKTRASRPNDGALRQTPASMGDIGEGLVEIMQAAIGPIVRQIVREDPWGECKKHCNEMYWGDRERDGPPAVKATMFRGVVVIGCVMSQANAVAGELYLTTGGSWTWDDKQPEVALALAAQLREAADVLEREASS